MLFNTAFSFLAVIAFNQMLDSFIDRQIEIKNRESWEVLRTQSRQAAEEIAGQLEGMSDEEAEEFLEYYDLEKSVSMILVNAEGKLIYDDGHGFAVDDMENSYSMPYVHAEINLESGRALFIYQSAAHVENVAGWIATFLLGIATILLFSILYYLLSRPVLLRIRRIGIQVNRISHGELSARIENPGRGELGDLERNINAMGESILTMMEEIKTAERQKQELISGLSHDLKTPLTSIIGYLNLLTESEKRGLSEDEKLRYTGLCYQQSLRMKKLADDLFIYLKFSDKGLRPGDQAFSLQTLVLQILEERQQELERRGINLESDTGDHPLEIRAEPDHLARVISNLMDNMERYCDGEKRARLILGVEGERAVLSLTNSAVGLRIEEPEWLFERMVRGDSSRSDGEGSGLGLAICRQIVELYGGRITASMDSLNFTIRLELPLLKPES